MSSRTFAIAWCSFVLGGLIGVYGWTAVFWIGVVCAVAFVLLVLAILYSAVALSGAHSRREEQDTDNSDEAGA